MYNLNVNVHFIDNNVVPQPCERQGLPANLTSRLHFRRHMRATIQLISGRCVIRTPTPATAGLLDRNYCYTPTGHDAGWTKMPP